FRHKPLVLSNSSAIRLIRVKPELSGSGKIQCSIEHTTTDSQYMCLSYVWGSTSSAEHLITIDEKTFAIHHNLSAFLHIARKKFPHQGFWIDAVCIDQANNRERNHQVQQMGLIYSKARRVIAWMGNDALIVRFFDLGNRSNYVPFSEPSGLKEFISNQYWSRAWITQEGYLAADLIFLAQDTEVSLNRIVNQVRLYDHGGPEFAYIRPLLSKAGIRGKSLLYLLYIFREKQCSIKADRIFSLLAICDKGSSLRVDYDLKEKELVRRVLESCPDEACFCTLGLLADVLDLWPSQH
ncbi:heterokaryon incompatibility protein-domain-containing protein, partial [Dendryphion nanum]